MSAKSQPLHSANQTKAQVLLFPSLLTGRSASEKTDGVISKFLTPFCSEQKDPEAWGEFINPWKNDPNKIELTYYW